MMLNEEHIRIINALKEGKEGAFEEVFYKYRNRIFFIGMQFFKDSTLAEDVVQETFITVYKSIHQLNNPEAFTVWIQKIAHQKCLRIAQSDRKKYADLGDEMVIEDFEDESESTKVEKVVAQKELFDIVNSEIQKMQPEFRDVAYFRLFEDMSVKEIAEIVGVPEGTIKSRLSKIRQKLQNSLKKKGIDLSIITTFVMFPGMLEFYNEFQNLYTLNTESSAQLFDNISKTVGAVTTISIASAAAPLAAEVTKVGVFESVKYSAFVKIAIGASVIGGGAIVVKPYINELLTAKNTTVEVFINKPRWGDERIEERIIKIPFYDNEDQIDFGSIRCDNCSLTVEKFSESSGEAHIMIEMGEKTTVNISNKEGNTSSVTIESIIK